MASILKFDEWQSTAGVKRQTVLQVVSAFDNAHYVFNGGSANQTTFFNISGLSVSITPSSTSSRIVLIASVGVSQYGDGYNVFLRFARGSTGIGTSQSNGIYANGGSAMAGLRTFNNYDQSNLAMCYVDSPATTSATTYNVQCCNSGGSGYPSYVNRLSATDTGWVQAMSSNLIAMEIAG